MILHGTRRLAALLAILALVLGTGSSFAFQDAPPADPERTEAGREAYLGREIARTMHWTGAEWLLRESRQDEENSSLVLSKLGLEAGQTVCDFGCGNGYYTLPMAEKVGAEGRVLAVDLQSEMLVLLKGRVKAAGLENVVAVQATLTDPGLEPESCDAILLVDVYHEISHPVTVLAGLRRALKPKGRLILVEFRLEDPEVPIKLKHKMSKAQMILEMSANGLQFASEFDGLPWQHLMAFERDPEFPRKAGQHEANGTAVAAGLERALRAGDRRSLPRFYDEQLWVSVGSRLLNAEEPAPLMMMRSEWSRRLAAHVESITTATWAASVEGIRLVKRAPVGKEYLDDQGDPRSLQFFGFWPGRESPHDPNASWTLTRNAAGQWGVIIEQFTH